MPPTPLKITSIESISAAPTANSACCPSPDVPVIDRREAERYADQFHALSDSTRIMIVNLLANRSGELTVGAVGEAVGVSQPTASHHLKILLQHGLVRRRRAGKCVYFFVDHDAVCALPTLARTVVGC